MAIEYAELRGKTDGMDLSVITEIADYFEQELNYRIDPRTPFVGEHFNATRAGIHADGMMKDEEIYNIFDTGKILNKPAKVLIGEHSGATGIAHWLNTTFRLPEDQKVNKRGALVEGIKKAIDEEYAKGRNTTFSWIQELLEIAMRVDEKAIAELEKIPQEKIKGKWRLFRHFLFWARRGMQALIFGKYRAHLAGRKGRNGIDAACRLRYTKYNIGRGGLFHGVKKRDP